LPKREEVTNKLIQNYGPKEELIIFTAGHILVTEFKVVMYTKYCFENLKGNDVGRSKHTEQRNTKMEIYFEDLNWNQLNNNKFQRRIFHEKQDILEQLNNYHLVPEDLMKLVVLDTVQEKIEV
jgi:hypothetical protein